MDLFEEDGYEKLIRSLRTRAEEDDTGILPRHTYKSDRPKRDFFRQRRTLGIVVAIAIVGKWAIMSAVAGSLLSMTSDFARLEITNSVARLTALFFQPLLIQGAVVGGIGIILIVIMLIRRRKGKGASSELPKTTTGEA